MTPRDVFREVVRTYAPHEFTEWMDRYDAACLKKNKRYPRWE